MVKLTVSSCLEAIAAIYWTVVLRLEWNLSLLTALSTSYSEHLALLTLATLTGTTALIAAIAATNWLVLKALLCVELLLTCAKDELLTAILTYQSLIFKCHEKKSPILITEHPICNFKLSLSGEQRDALINNSINVP